MSETASDVKFRNLEKEVEDLKTTCGEFRKDIRGVHDFQIWLTGALAAAAFFCGLFATEIKKAFTG